MKLTVVSALFASAAHAVKVNQPTQSLAESASFAQIQALSTQRMESKLKVMDLDELSTAAKDAAEKAKTKADTKDQAVA